MRHTFFPGGSTARPTASQPRKSWPGADTRRYLEYSPFTRAPWLTPKIAENEYAMCIAADEGLPDPDADSPWPIVPDLHIPALSHRELERLATIEFSYAP